VAFSLDGKTLAVLSESEIAFWDVATLERHPYGLRDHTRPVYQVACSTDGQRLLTVDRYELVQVRDPLTLRVVGDWRGSWSDAYATDPTVNYLAGWDRDERVLSLHQAVDGRVVFTATTSRPTAMAFDGTERLATADNIGHIRLWDIATGKIVTTLTQGRVSVTNLALAPDGRRLASSDAAGRLSLYRIRTDHAYTALHNPPFITATLEVPLTHTVALAFAPDGATLAALFSQPEAFLAVVRLWDIETDVLRREWIVPDGDPRDLIWNLDGSRLAVSTSKGVYVWDPRDGREVVRLPRGGAGYTGGQMAFCARDDWQMLAVSHGSWVGLWDIP
jgi:WD40 repeat protein